LFTKDSIETYFLAEKNAQLICMLLSVAALLFAALFFFYYKTEKTKPFFMDGDEEKFRDVMKEL
jgi:hypothetical protein